MSKDARRYRSETAPSGAPDIRTAEPKAVPARATGWMINLRRKLIEVQAESDQLSERARESLARALEMIGSALPSSLSVFPCESEDSTDDGLSIQEYLGRPLSVLLVGSHADQLESLFTGLGAPGELPKITLTRDTGSARTMLSRDSYDLLVYAHAPSEMFGFDELSQLQIYPACPPVLFVTTEGSEELAAGALKAGLYDYIRQEDLTPLRIRKTVHQVLRRQHLEAELEAAYTRLSELVNHDPLTELYNRRYFENRLAIEFSRAHRFGEPLSLILLDIDRFKDINDQYGHPAGDRVLVNTGITLSSLARTIDIVARIGGEEFALILPNTQAAGAAALAERLIARIRKDRIIVNGKSVGITVSAGVAALPECRAETRAELLESADQALYVAKKSGRDQISRFKP